MKVDEILGFLARHKVAPDDARVTHRSIEDNSAYSFGDGNEDQEQLARYAFEANRLKQALSISENPFSGNFKLYFDLLLPSGEENVTMMRETAASIVKAGLSDLYDMDLEMILYAAKEPDGQDRLHAQVVFPDVIVDIDRARQIRTEVMEKLQQQKSPLEKKIAIAGYTLQEAIVDFSPAKLPTVPLCYLPIGKQVGCLNPVNIGVFDVKTKTVKAKNPPDDAQKYQWVQRGLKRMASGTMTAWNEPKGQRAGDRGKTGSGGSPKGKDDAAKSGKSGDGSKGFSYGGDKYGK